MQQSTQSRSLAFFCVAAPKDKKLFTEWETHLLPLQQAQQITLWSEQNISAGKDINQECLAHLEQADVIILLLSPDFFNTSLCLTLMGQAMERCRNDNPPIVIPLLLRPVLWEPSLLGQLDPLPVNRLSVTRWVNRDDAFHTCVQEICSLVKLPPPVRRAASLKPLFRRSSFRRLLLLLMILGLILLFSFTQIGSALLQIVTSAPPDLTAIVILFTVLGLLLIIMLSADPIKRILKRRSLL